MKDHYPFEFIKDGFTPTYFFITNDKVIYEVRFKYSPYIFENFDDVSKNTYEFVLVPTEGSLNSKGSDTLIGATVSEIFKHFFSNKANVVIYACDNSDGRAAARDRKFNHWFEHFSGISYIKCNLLLPEADSVIYLSMILHSKNPLRYRAFEAFDSLQDNNK